METEARPKPTFSARARWGVAFNVGVAVVALLVLVLMVNYLSARHLDLRWSLSEQRAVKLSPQTLRVLQSLTNTVKVTIFFNTREEEALHEMVTSLLNEYAYANPRILFKTVDPARQPADAELVLAAHRLGALKDKSFVVFDCDGRTKVIYQNELADVQVEPVMDGQTPAFRKKFVSFRGEMLFTTAIFNLANPRHFKICFVQGHGEHDPEKANNPHGYAKFAEVLKEKTDAEWEKLYLLGTNEIPSDCQLLVIAGPRLPYSDQELAKVENFLKQGGRLFALLNNLALGGRSGLEAILAKWGVAVGDKMVLDPKYSPTGNDLLTAQINGQHPVMRALLSDSEDMRVLLVLPRAVGQLKAGPMSPDAPKVDVLAATSENGTEVSEIRDGVPYRNPFQDKQGVFPLIAAVEQGSIKGVSPERGSTRIIVVGDSLCLDNELINSPPANHYFAALAVNWLLDRPRVLLEGLVPQPVKEYRLIMTQQQLQTTQWLLLAGLPGGVLLLGLLVWWRRRH